MKPRPSYIPHQSRISVMDVHNTDTNAGISMENEEMRRIRIAIEGEMQALTPGVTDQVVGSLSQSLGAASKKPDDIKRSIWALTTEENTKIIVDKVCQDLRFINRKDRSKAWLFPVFFRLKKERLEPELRTIDNAERTIIEADAHVYPRELQSLMEGRKSIIKIYEDWDGTNYFEFVNDEWYPGSDMFYGTNGRGVKGWRPMKTFYLKQTLGSGEQNKLIGTIPANSVINRISIEVETEFDADYIINVGDGVAQARLWRFENDVRSKQHYEQTLNYIYTDDTDVYISSDAIISSGLLTVYVYIN